jgi:hypothetical protein
MWVYVIHVASNDSSDMFAILGRLCRTAGDSWRSTGCNSDCKLSVSEMGSILRFLKTDVKFSFVTNS